MNFYMKFTTIYLLLVCHGAFVSSQTLDIKITNIQNRKGQLCIAVFDSQKGFSKEKVYWDTCICKRYNGNNELHILISIKPGKYGLSVLDDENGSAKMEYNFLGIPREGFGFSNYYQKGIRKPTFDDFSFCVGKNETKVLHVEMKYF